MNDGDGKKMLQLRKCPGFLRLHFYPIRKLWRGYAKSGPSSVLKTFVVYRLLCTFFFSVGVVCYVFLLHSCRLLCLSAPLVSSATYFCSVRIVCYVRIFCPLVSSAPSEESPARQMEWWPSMAHFRTVPVMACALSLYFDRRGRKRKRENLSIRAFSPNSVAGTSLLLL